MSSPANDGNVKKEIYRLLKTLLLLFSPLLALYVLVEIIAWETGESVPIGTIAKWQSESSDHMWRGGDGRSYLTYKLARTELIKPDVLILGASRANSFRHEDFAPYSFYNSALCGWTFTHYLRYLQLLTAHGYAPKVLIFNLDYWMFSEDFDGIWRDRFYEKGENHLAALKIVLDHTMDSIEWPGFPHARLPVFPGTPDPNNKLWNRISYIDRYQGLYAVLTGDGIRQDGALLYSGVLPTDPARLIHDFITVGIPPAEGGDAMAQNQLEAFEKFAAFAKSKNITLIGVQMPYYDKIVSGFKTFPHAGMWREVRSPERKRYFAEHGVMFFDYADMPEYRTHPERFLDSAHPDKMIVSDIVRRLRHDSRVREAFIKAGLADPATNDNAKP